MTVSAKFSSYIGEDVLLTNTIYSDAAKTTPANITGWSIQFVAYLLGGPPVITQTTANGGITLTDPTNGVLAVSLPKALTQNLLPYIYSFYIERTDAGADAVLTDGSWNLQKK